MRDNETTFGADRGGAMQFGRVDGFVTAMRNGQRHLTIVLDTGRDLETLRDEPVPASLDVVELVSLVEQLVSEVLANDLEEEGWEVLGEGDTGHESHAMLDIVARSKTWVVRRSLPE